MRLAEYEAHAVNTTLKIFPAPAFVSIPCTLRSPDDRAVPSVRKCLRGTGIDIIPGSGKTRRKLHNCIVCNPTTLRRTSLAAFVSAIRDMTEGRERTSVSACLQADGWTDGQVDGQILITGGNGT